MGSELVSLVGFLKLVNVFFGLLILGLASYAYEETSSFLKIAKNDEEIIKYFGGVARDDGRSLVTVQYDLRWTPGLELTLISFSVIALIGSLAIFTVRGLTDSGGGRRGRLIDFGFHVFGAVLYLIGGICLLFAAIETDSKICGMTGVVANIPGFPNSNQLIQIFPRGGCRTGWINYGEKVSASVFSFINVILYATTAFLAINLKELQTKGGGK